MRSSMAGALAALSASISGIGSAHADCATQYFVFAEQDLHIADRVQIGRGPVGARHSAEFGVTARMQGDVMAPAITLRNGATINGSTYAIGNVTLQDGARILINTLPFTQTQECSPVPLPAVQPGTGQHTVGGGLELPPGHYGAFSVSAGSTLVASSGDYHFASLTFEPDSQLIIMWNGGPTRFLVNQVSFGDRHRQTINGSSARNVLQVFSTQISQLRLGVSSSIEAQVVAPFAELNVPPNTTAYGRLYGKTVRIEPDAIIGKPVTTVPTTCQ